MAVIGYKEIADDLRRRVKGEEWPLGDRLPGISELQDEYGVRSLNVIRRAQAVLVKEGLLRTEQGRGVYVAGLGVPTATDLLAELDRSARQLERALAQHAAAVAAAVSAALGRGGRADVAAGAPTGGLGPSLRAPGHPGPELATVRSHTGTT